MFAALALPEPRGRPRSLFFAGSVGLPLPACCSDARERQSDGYDLQACREHPYRPSAGSVQSSLSICTGLPFAGTPLRQAGQGDGMGVLQACKLDVALPQPSWPLSQLNKP